MFWIGRLNSILAIITFAGLVLVWATGGIQAAGGWLIVMFLLRIAFGVLNTIWTAITGNPLFYDTKILGRERQDD